MGGMTDASVAEEAYNEAISFLQKAKTTGGASVYEHLTAVLGKVCGRFLVMGLARFFDSSAQGSHSPFWSSGPNFRLRRRF